MASKIEWIVSQLTTHDKVKSLTMDNEIIVIQRKKGEELRVAVVSNEYLTTSDVQHLYNSVDIGFLLNIQKDAYISGGVINSFEHRQIAVGGLGDLYRILNQEYNWPYQNPEIKFVQRGLEQHTKVSRLNRLDSRRFEIERQGLSTVTILVLNDYDLSVESVRSGKQVYKDYDAILASNPNVRISNEAYGVAKGMNVNIYKWAELLGKLNLKWI